MSLHFFFFSSPSSMEPRLAVATDDSLMRDTASDGSWPAADGSVGMPSSLAAAAARPIGADQYPPSYATGSAVHPTSQQQQHHPHHPHRPHHHHHHHHMTQSWRSATAEPDFRQRGLHPNRSAASTTPFGSSQVSADSEPASASSLGATAPSSQQTSSSALSSPQQIQPTAHLRSPSPTARIEAALRDPRIRAKLQEAVRQQQLVAAENGTAAADRAHPAVAMAHEVTAAAGGAAYTHSSHYPPDPYLRASEVYREPSVSSVMPATPWYHHQHPAADFRGHAHPPLSVRPPQTWRSMSVQPERMRPHFSLLAQGSPVRCISMSEPVYPICLTCMFPHFPTSSHLALCLRS